LISPGFSDYSPQINQGYPQKLTTYPQKTIIIWKTMQIVLGILLASAIAYASYWLGALNRSGGVAAMLCGTLIFGLGGLPWAVLLLIFFITSSSLSRVFAGRKKPLSERFSKSSQRDSGQVLANGGLGTLLVLIHAILPHQSWPWIAFAGAMAAVTADTWATDLGVLSPVPARLVRRGPIDRVGNGDFLFIHSRDKPGGIGPSGGFVRLNSRFSFRSQPPSDLLLPKMWEGDRTPPIPLMRCKDSSPTRLALVKQWRGEF
jgi:hypothetical protein